MISAAGIMLLAPSGRALFLQRSSAGDAAGQWTFPGGKLEAGEDAAAAAVRETLEETGYRVGSPGRVLCRRVADDVDYTTFITSCDDEFTPKLDEENTAFVWMTPADALGVDVESRLDAGSDVTEISYCKTAPDVYRVTYNGSVLGDSRGFSRLQASNEAVRIVKEEQERATKENRFSRYVYRAGY